MLRAALWVAGLVALAAALPKKGQLTVGATVELSGARGGTGRVIDGEYTETSEILNGYPTYKNADGSRWLVRSKSDGTTPGRWYVQDTGSKGLNGGWAYTEAESPNPKSPWRVWTGAEWESQSLQTAGYLLPSKKVDVKKMKKDAEKTAAGEVADIIKKGHLHVPKAIQKAATKMSSTNAADAAKQAESDDQVKTKKVHVAAAHKSKTKAGESTHAAAAAKQVETANSVHTSAEHTMAKGLQAAGYHANDVKKIMSVFASTIQHTNLLGEGSADACTPQRAAAVLRDHIVETSAAITKITGKPVPPATPAKEQSAKEHSSSLPPVKNSFVSQSNTPAAPASSPPVKPSVNPKLPAHTTAATAPKKAVDAHQPSTIETNRLGEAPHFSLSTADRAKVEAAAKWEPKSKGPAKLSAADEAKVQAVIQKELQQSQSFLSNLDDLDTLSVDSTSIPPHV